MSNIHKKLLIAGGSLVGVLVISSLLFAPQLKGWFYSRALPTTYFSHFEDIEPALYQVAGNVYAFEMAFTRSMVVRSSEGIAVFDTFSDHHADEMKKAIASEFPGEEIKWVVFSHNHLDHIRGSHLFKGAEVIGHRALNSFVEDWPKAGRGGAWRPRHDI